MSSEGAQIYIPNSCLYKRGLMIGYNISGFCIHVIDVQDKISAVEIERTLRDPSLDKFNSLCHANLIVLGIALNAGEPLPESCIERMENNNIWVNMEIQKSNDSYPFSLKDLYVCGYKYKVRCEIVAYDDRSDRRLMTLNRAALAEDLFESNRLETFIQSSPAIQNDRTNLDQTLREYFEKSDNIYDKNYDLNTVELLRAKTIQEDPNFNREVPNLTYIIKQINLCHVIRKAYHIALKQNAGKPVENAAVQEEEKTEKTEKTEEIVEDKKVESAVWNSEEYKEMEKTTLYRQSLAILNPWRFITVIFIFFFQFQRIGFLLFGNFISFKIPIVNKSLRDYGLFTHVYDEIVFKLKIMEKWPLWLSILNNKSQSSNYIFLFQVYNKLYSGLTFMIADTLIGLLFTYAMYSHAQNILHIIHMLFQGFHIKDLVEKVGWLLDEPSGFKANRDFNRAIGAVVTFLLNIWEYYTTFITPYEGVLLKVFSFYGLGGMSFVLVIGKEVIRIYTLHIWFLYNALTKVYNYWLESFNNFFAILRDKRINNITKKKEDFEFEWPQKLIATTIAITLISLLPTLLMYYVWSLWMQIAVLIMNVILTKVVDFINEFPLFLLISYFVDPESVFPCGLAFQLPKKIKSSDSGNRPSKQNGDGLSDYLELHPQKMPINFIISPFVKKITKLSAQFKLNNLVSFIFKGISIFSTISYNDRSKRDDRRVLKMNFSSIKDDIKTFLSL